MEQMTIREAARELGITPQALRSRAKHRGVILEKAPGPHGERYLVNAADLPLLRDGTVPQDRPVEPSRENVSQANDVIPLSAHLEVIHLLRETQRHLQEAQEQRHKSQEAMRLLERQTMALQWELTNYRRALSENAESLAEQAARARQVEYQVQLAENGEEGVQAALAGRFDAIIMDMRMPKLDGLGATRQIRGQDGPNRAVPIIALTGNAFEEDRQRGLAAGCTDYLAKPIRISTLREVLTRYVR